MAYQSIGLVPWPPYPNAISGAPDLSSIATIDASGEKCAIILNGITGSIRRVYVRTATVTTGGTVDVRIETVSGAGEPTGTLWATNTNASLVIGSGDDNVWLQTGDLTADATVVASDTFAIVMVCGSPGNIQLAGFADMQIIAPYRQVFAASWTAGLVPPLFVPSLSDGTYPEVMGVPWVGGPINTGTFTNATSTTRRGNIFNAVVPMQAPGAWYWRAGSNTGNFSIKIYDTDGTTVLATTGTIDGDVRGGSNTSIFYAPFTSVATIPVANGYRLAVVAESATNVGYYDLDVPAAGMMGAMAGGTGMYRSLFTSGSWAETTTSRTYVGLMLRDFDDGTTPPPAAGSVAYPSFG